MAVVQSTLRISLMEDVVARSRHITNALNGLRAQSMATFAPLRGLMAQTIALGAGYLGASRGISATAGAAIEFESAFADVKKVVEATDEQFENMRRGIRRMSGEIPLAANDIAALFAAAGESGVATEELQGFSEMAARVGIAFNMSAGEAGDSLAKLKTQLGLTVAETGDMADTINHLSNNMASNARQVTEFMLRIGAFGEMGGFLKEDLAAIGSAMIAAGADASTAGTAMQNVVRALTKGSSAKKNQKDAAKALGLDLPAIAKDMQKDAKGTVRRVLQAVAKAPKDRQISLLSGFFGDEARAFMPLVGNIELLDQALASVSDRTKYAGSAFREYMERANTTGNVLDLLRNKMANVFWEIGDRMLPTIRDAALGVGDVIDTMGERASVFDRMKIAVQGFLQGFGVDGGVRQLMNDLGDLLFGPVDGAAGDKLGRLFMQAKEWGASIRELSDAVRDNPIAKFFASIAPYGFQIMLWGTGIAVLAGAVRKLAAALMLLSGATTILAALKTVGSIAAIAGGGAVAAGLAGGKGTPNSPAAKPNGGNPLPLLLGIARLATYGMAAGGAWEFGKATHSGDTLYRQGKAWLPGPEDALHAAGSFLKSILSTDGGDGFAEARQKQEDDFLASWRRQYGGEQAGGDRWANFTNSLPKLEYSPVVPAVRQWPSAGGNERPIKIDAETLREMAKPSGTQDVRVVNQQPPNVMVNAPITITGASDPQATANAIGGELGAAIKSAVESTYSD